MDSYLTWLASYGVVSVEYQRRLKAVGKACAVR